MPSHSYSFCFSPRPQSPSRSASAWNAATRPFNWSQVEATEDSVPIDGNQGYAGGYDVEIAKRIAEGLGRELVIVKLEWVV